MIRLDSALREFPKVPVCLPPTSAILHLPFCFLINLRWFGTRSLTAQWNCARPRASWSTAWKWLRRMIPVAFCRSVFISFASYFRCLLPCVSVGHTAGTSSSLTYHVSLKSRTYLHPQWVWESLLQNTVSGILGWGGGVGGAHFCSCA